MTARGEEGVVDALAGAVYEVILMACDRPARYPQPSEARGIIAALAAAGFVIVPRAEIERALKDASDLDNWHRHGEGYATLREAVQKLLAP